MRGDFRIVSELSWQQTRTCLSLTHRRPARARLSVFNNSLYDTCYNCQFCDKSSSPSRDVWRVWQVKLIGASSEHLQGSTPALSVEYRSAWTLIHSEGSSDWNGGCLLWSSSQLRCLFRRSTIHTDSMSIFLKDLSGLLTLNCPFCLLVTKHCPLQQMSTSSSYLNSDCDHTTGWHKKWGHCLTSHIFKKLGLICMTFYLAIA